MTARINEVYVLLKSILSGTATLSEINALIRIAFQFSLVRLKQLANSGKINLHSFQISLEAASIDCIADMFKRNQDGEFIEIKDFFSEERSIEILSMEAAYQHFRCLVFTKLQDGIARLYWDSDPIYSKIIRNLKIHLRHSKSINKFEMFGEIYIYSCEEDKMNDNFPEFPIDEFESALISKIKLNDNIKNYLDTALDILNDQEKYQKFFSLSGLATIIKKIVVKQLVSEKLIYSIEDNIFVADLNKVIFESLQKTKELLYEKYVQTGKLEREKFDHFHLAVEEILYYSVVENGNEVDSFIHYIKKHNPEMDADEYHKRYRNQFEYMVKIARKNLIEELKELL